MTAHSGYIKKVYDDYARLGEKYEYQRWKQDIFCRRDYDQTLKSFLYHLDSRHFRRVLEIGCGAGTWTVQLRRFSENITLADISRRMIQITMSRLHRLDFDEISGVVCDFQTSCLEKNERYDAVFCIRAIEYMEDKLAALSNMYRLLNPRGFVFIITKNPHRGAVPFLSLITKKTIFKLPRAFSHEIHYKDLLVLMQNAGFTRLNAYPAVISYPNPPVAGRYEVRLSNAMFESAYRKHLNPFHLPFGIIESYCILAKK